MLRRVRPPLEDVPTHLVASVLGTEVNRGHEHLGDVLEM
jgi:hypothetical protein